MKILLMLPGLTVGGLERMAVTLANALTRRGHEITIITYNPNSDTLASELDKGVRYINKGLKPHPIMGHIPYVRHKFYDDGMWETRATPERLYKYYVGKDKYDVEIAFFRGLSVKTLSAHRKLKDTISGQLSPRRLAWVHTDFTKAVGWNNNFKNIEAVRRAYSSYDHVICVSRHALEGFIETIGDTGNLTTIYNMLPVDDIVKKGADHPSVTVSRHQFNIVLVARLMDRAKGQCRLIEALADLRKEGYDIGLTLVGDGPDRTLIEECIKKTLSENHVGLVGNQTNPYPYIKCADLLVCASYYEGYNLTVAEALILGTPVLSTRCTGPVEILDDGKYGMIVENSTEALTDGLHSMATDCQLYAHYKSMAKERLSFFNQEMIISKIESLLR